MALHSRVVNLICIQAKVYTGQAVNLITNHRESANMKKINLEVKDFLLGFFIGVSLLMGFYISKL